jgi:hypothetical protein
LLDFREYGTSMQSANVMIWHVHGAWTEAFVQGGHRYLLPVEPGNPHGRKRPRWPPNVVEVTPDEARGMPVDAVIFQRSAEIERAARWLVSRRLGRDVAGFFLEHNALQGRISEMRHPFADRDDLEIVQVTHFNALFWDVGLTRTRVIEHGIPDTGERFTGELSRVGVVINEAARRGRVTGTDLLPWFETFAPIDLFGIGTERDLPQEALYEQLGRRRLYLHPYRWTSLGLALLEAMCCALPVVALATTEVPSAVPASAGIVSNDRRVLAEAVRWLVADPDAGRALGRAGRKHVLERYGLARFLHAWDVALAEALAALPAAAGRSRL